jgi:hypothetical protein
MTSTWPSIARASRLTIRANGDAKRWLSVKEAPRAAGECLKIVS